MGINLGAFSNQNFQKAIYFSATLCLFFIITYLYTYPYVYSSPSNEEKYINHITFYYHAFALCGVIAAFWGLYQKKSIFF